MRTHPAIQMVTAMAGLIALSACDPKPVSADPEMATGKTPSSGPQPEAVLPNEPGGKSQTYVGLPLKKAEQIADVAGLRHRVIMVDGESMMVTKDFIPTRLNFTVVNGVVTAVTNG